MCLLNLTSKFTSHYVSINSRMMKLMDNGVSNLHPTMYLLIHMIPVVLVVVLLYLHPTMYLLIPSPLQSCDIVLKFTSHYVSINSRNY